jgi:hypothetical protein
MKEDQGAHCTWAANIEDRFLRADGTGVSQENPVGGKVNCQFFSGKNSYGNPEVGPLEKFFWQNVNGGTINVPHYAVYSKQFPHCYLRLDGSGVTENNPKGNEAQLQFVADDQVNSTNYPECVFVYRQQGHTRTYAMESLAYPGVYLAIDGESMSQSHDHGGGSVYASWGISKYTVLQSVAGY